MLMFYTQRGGIETIGLYVCLWPTAPMVFSQWFLIRMNIKSKDRVFNDFSIHMFAAVFFFDVSA